MERPSKIELMNKIAYLVSLRSTCKRLQVGAIITDEDLHTIKAYGYNGNYTGGPNTCDSSEPGKCGCVHAEINALIKPNRIGGKTMFVTDSPCIPCAKAIINAGIKTLYYNNAYRDSSGIELLKKAKVKVIKLKQWKTLTT